VKLPFLASCRSGVPDSIEVLDSENNANVILLGRTDGQEFSVILSVDTALQLRKALKKAARQAEATRIRGSS